MLPPSIPPMFYNSPFPTNTASSPTVTPPLTSSSLGPLMTSTSSSLMTPTSLQQQLSPHGEQHSPGSDRGSVSSGGSGEFHHHGYFPGRGSGDQLSTEYMLPGRVISSSHQGNKNGGKRLPIFNQLSISHPVC